MTNHYTLGFAFTTDWNHVLLILKNRPPFQSGLWNGIGGKVEPGESGHETMAREFQEECNLVTYPFSWTRFAIIQNVQQDYLIDCFFLLTDGIRMAQTMTDEEVEIFRLPLDCFQGQSEFKMKSEVPFLIKMAEQYDPEIIEPYRIFETPAH